MADTRRPIKLLCVDQCANVGGAQKSLLDLLDAFASRGWQPSVIAPAGSPFTENVRKSGYQNHGLNCGTYSSIHKSLAEHVKYALNVPQLIGSLSRAVQANGVNLLYVNGGRLFPPAAWVARAANIPVVFHIHNRLVQASAAALAGRSLQWTSGQLIACCRHAAAPLRRYVDPRRLNVLYNGVRPVAPTERKVVGKLRRIGVVGRVEVEKGQLEFVRAARLLSDLHPECRFSVIGRPLFSGAEYYLRVVAAAKDLPVDFIGWQEDLRAVYADLDLLVVPSSCLESTTRVILEAYSAGVPVVAFPSGGIPEIVKDNETGFLTVEPTAGALVSRIHALLEMENTELMKIIHRAREVWAQRYTLEIYREGVCDVLEHAASLSEP